MAAKSPGPTFEVHVDEVELGEDLAHATEAAKATIKPMVDELRSDGVAADWLKKCDAEAQDGTRPGGCVKL